MHNFYIPAGGDIPDREANPKFDHKLLFPDALENGPAIRLTPQVLVGDLNIAPREDDVWSHKQLLKIISHTPVETEGPTVSWRQGSGLMRCGNSSPKASSIPGGRIAHGIGMLLIVAEDLTIYGTPPLADQVSHAGVLRDVRGWEQPSDHAPLWQ